MGIFRTSFFIQGGGIDPKDFSEHFDGVFWVSREDVPVRVKELINLKLQRDTNLPTFRGWTVADTIELEILLSQALVLCFGGYSSLFDERVISKEGLFDLGKKHQVLVGIIKDYLESKDEGKEKELRACAGTLKQFDPEIIEVRNALAHEMAKDVDGKTVVKTRRKKGKDIEFTYERCVQIRKDIKKHRENLRALCKWIDSNDLRKA